jgi:hypothetical protein
VEDVPWNMPQHAYGVFEPEGLSIWVNTERQDDLDTGVAVISHEFTHYVHSLSTLHSIDDLLSLIFSIHSGIQRLEDLEQRPTLPLMVGSTAPQCPPFVKEFIERVEVRTRRIHDSLGRTLDSAPPEALSVGGLYTMNGTLFIKTSAVTGAPVARLSMMEGAALAKKCETLGNDDDLKSKMRNPKLSHYFAAHHACLAANPRIDPLSASAVLCDIALCTPVPREIFERGISALADLSASATLDDFEQTLVSLYDQFCRKPMDARLRALERARHALPLDHRSDDSPSWAELALRNAIQAVRRRQEAPLSLIKPPYFGKPLFELASMIGSPVIITNDMRLSSLAEASEGATRARNSMRTLSYICQWIIRGSGPLRCPYAGCPDCPEARKGAHCETNAVRALLPSDETPWCALLFSAHQLRVAPLLRSAANAASTGK